MGCPTLTKALIIWSPEVNYLFMERKPPLLACHRGPLVRLVPRDILGHYSELCSTEDTAMFTHSCFILV